VSELPGETYEKWVVELEPEERPETPSIDPEDESQEVPEDVN
jgi:hypothetical protein